MKPYYQDAAVTLYHGDCREVLEWLAADVLITDPPYGIAYPGGRPLTGSAAATRDRERPIAGDQDAAIRDEALAAWGSPARPALAFGSWRAPKPKGTGQVLVWWKREQKNLSRHWGRAWASNWEEIYLLGDWPKLPGQDAGHGVIPTDEHRSAAYGATATLGHPTPKPVLLMEQLIARAPTGIVADPFAGVGATLLAARNLGRRAIGVEIEEHYCEIAAKRLAQDTLFGGVGA